MISDGAIRIGWTVGVLDGGLRDCDPAYHQLREQGTPGAVSARLASWKEEDLYRHHRAGSWIGRCEHTNYSYKVERWEALHCQWD